MKFNQPSAQIFIPNGMDAINALARTTHMGIGAHQDDLEIMATDGILACYLQNDRWFSGVVVTDGRGSPRSGIYANFSDAEMHAARVEEQKKAAKVGDYAAQVFLNYPSSVVKDKLNLDPIKDLIEVFRCASPSVVYTHNLADKHETHVAVALKTIAAIRGVEIWRDLDWMRDRDKVVFDVSQHENLQAALLGVFDSQITGGKRYDLAAMGRRRANATYFESRGVDVATGLIYAMDLTPLIQDDRLDISLYVKRYIERFMEDVMGRLS